MELWVQTWSIPPPHNKTILARYGANVCFVAYSRTLDRWRLVAGPGEEAIAPAPAWFCDGEYAAANRIPDAKPPLKIEKTAPRMRSRKGAQQQITLGLEDFV